VLLWQKRDAGLLAHFIEQVSDAAEKQRAWQRYHEIRGFAESSRCRHLQICRHFGETPKWKTCDACDVCGSEPDWLAAPEEVETAALRKLKSRPTSKGRPIQPLRAQKDAPRKSIRPARISPRVEERNRETAKSPRLRRHARHHAR